MKKLLLTVLAMFLLTSVFNEANGEEISQKRWVGELRLPNEQSLPLELTLYTQSYGTTANLSSPAQGVSNIPATELAVSEHGLAMMLPTLGAELSLTTQEDRCLHGELKQGVALAVKLCPATPAAEEPEQSWPFQADDGVWLSGRLFLPAQGEVDTIAIIAQGSGPTDRDGSFGQHKLYENLALNLAAENIAVFSYDKRGIRRSQGNYIEADVSDFTADYLAAQRFVRAQFPHAAIGYIGHSEGSTVVAMAANKVAPSFVVSLGGVGLKGIDAIVLQDKTESMAKGATAAQALVLQDIASDFYQAVLAAENNQDRESTIRELLAQLTPAQRDIYNTYGANTYTLAIDNIHDAGLHGILATDPTQYWRELCLPTLIMNGNKDVQVPAEANTTGIRQALASCADTRIEVAILPNYNHMFQTTEDGSVDRYQQLPNGFGREVTQRIAQWIHSVKSSD